MTIARRLMLVIGLFLSACGFEPASDRQEGVSSTQSSTLGQASLKIVLTGKRDPRASWLVLRQDPSINERRFILGAQEFRFDNLPVGANSFLVRLEDANGGVVSDQYIVVNLQNWVSSQVYVNASSLSDLHGNLVSDVWTSIQPGVDYLAHTTSAPQVKSHTVYIDLRRASLKVRATRPEERGKTVSAFAKQLNAIVAINGDMFSGNYKTQNLAIGDGALWPGTSDGVASRTFLACDRFKVCSIDTSEQAQPINPNWMNVVGGDGVVVSNGHVYKEEGGCNAGCNEPNPRTSMGLSADGRYLILTVVEGRRSDSAGLGLSELGFLQRHLGAANAINNDGGGSSALVIRGKLVSGLPSGSSERKVANHLAILNP